MVSDCRNSCHVCPVLDSLEHFGEIKNFEGPPGRPFFAKPKKNGDSFIYTISGSLFSFSHVEIYENTDCANTRILALAGPVSYFVKHMRNTPSTAHHVKPSGCKPYIVDIFCGNQVMLNT